MLHFQRYIGRRISGHAARRRGLLRCLMCAPRPVHVGTQYSPPLRLSRPEAILVTIGTDIRPTDRLSPVLLLIHSLHKNIQRQRCDSPQIAKAIPPGRMPGHRPTMRRRRCKPKGHGAIFIFCPGLLPLPKAGEKQYFPPSPKALFPLHPYQRESSLFFQTRLYFRSIEPRKNPFAAS